MALKRTTKELNMNTNLNAGRRMVAPVTGPEQDVSRLELLHREYLARYKGKTTVARVQELVGNYIRARQNKAEMEQRMLKAAQAESRAAEDLVRECCGKSRVAIDGVPYIPMSRGTRVFFRKDMTDYVDLTAEAQGTA